MHLAAVTCIHWSSSHRH